MGKQLSASPPKEGDQCVVGKTRMTFHNGFWGHVCPDPRDLEHSEFMTLVRERLAKEGVKQWPESLTLQLIRRDEIRDQAQLRRIDGGRMHNRLPVVLTWWIRSYRGEGASYEEVGSDIRTSVEHIVAGIVAELRAIERAANQT